MAIQRNHQQIKHHLSNGNTQNNFWEKLPKMPSHYCRKDTKLMYLKPELTTEKVYQLYKEQIDSEKVTGVVSMKIFRTYSKK
jgi:hypothetical protein